RTTGRDRTLEHQRIELGTRGIQSRCVASRSRPDDDDIPHVGHCRLLLRITAPESTEQWPARFPLPAGSTGRDRDLRDDVRAGPRAREPNNDDVKLTCVSRGPQYHDCRRPTEIAGDVGDENPPPCCETSQAARESDDPDPAEHGSGRLSALLARRGVLPED